MRHLSRWVIALSFIAACEPSHKDVHSHGESHDHGPHADDTPQSRTGFADGIQVTVEYQRMVAGERAEMLIHASKTSPHSPLSGTLAVVLAGEQPGERFEATESSPGIFKVEVTPKYVDKRTLVVAIDGPDKRQVSLGEIDVTKEAQEVPSTKRGHISFSYESQWKVDFTLSEVTTRSLRPSMQVNATITPSSQGEAVVAAPFDGRIALTDFGAQVGQVVTQGDIVAYVIPNLSASEIALLRTELRKADVELARAKRELKRVEGLVQTGAIPQKRKLDAQSDVELAQAERDQVNRRLRQSQNLQSKGRGIAGRIAIRSPINGTIAERRLVDGGFVKSGDKLLHVVDRSQLWLEAHVSESDLAALKRPTGAWFLPSSAKKEQKSTEVPTPIEIEVTESGGLVSFGEIIDPHTRTVPLIFQIGGADRRDLRVGAFVRAHIFTDEPSDAVAIPASAILNEKGLDVVFVMTTGETFERRTIRTGIRDRNWVEVLDGLQLGERVVSTGAYYVKLAGTETAAVGHGHAH